MADLFYYTDKDGDAVKVSETVELAGRHVTVSIGDEKGWQCAVYLDRDAALRLADALLSYYGPDAPADLPVEGQQVLIEEEERG